MQTYLESWAGEFVEITSITRKEVPGRVLWEVAMESVTGDPLHETWYWAEIKRLIAWGQLTRDQSRYNGPQTLHIPITLRVEGDRLVPDAVGSVQRPDTRAARAATYGISGMSYARSNMLK